MIIEANINNEVVGCRNGNFYMYDKDGPIIVSHTPDSHINGKILSDNLENCKRAVAIKVNPYGLYALPLTGGGYRIPSIEETRINGIHKINDFPYSVLIYRSDLGGWYSIDELKHINYKYGLTLSVILYLQDHGYSFSSEGYGGFYK